MKLPVIEIFDSIQGEGSRIGTMATFVRLAGCNLACKWCDTTYSWKDGEMAPVTKLSAEEIAHRITQRELVLTGGEPTLHDLTELIRLSSKPVTTHITVETNATKWRDWKGVDLWSLSPKLFSSRMTFNRDVLWAYITTGRAQLKLVIDGPSEFNEARNLVGSLPVGDSPIIFQPVGSPMDAPSMTAMKLRHLVSLVVADPMWRRYDVKVLPQLHKIVWGEERGV